MHCLIYCVFIVVLIFIAYPGQCSDSNDIIPVVSISEEKNDLDKENVLDETKSIAAAIEIQKTTSIIDSVVENIVDDVTEIAFTSTTNLVTTATTSAKKEKLFLTQYTLNANLSLSLSDMILNDYLDNLVILISQEHEIILINKSDGTIKQHFKYAHMIPINQQAKQSNFLAIFDDNTQELWIFNSTHAQNSIISFKPKQISLFSDLNDLWIAETSDEVSLHVTQNNGIDWKQINDSSTSTVLGWSKQSNTAVILQHARYIKLLDTITHQMAPILDDVASTKIFSRYLLAKQNDNTTVFTNVKNLVDGSFRPLPKRFQSQGNFYCAIEDIYTQDLLLLFMTDNKLQENNETSLSTCNLVSYKKKSLFNLPNIHCDSINRDQILNTIECPLEQIPFYQVRGLSKSSFIANIAAPELITVVSFNGGETWNKTSYECDKGMHCPDKIVIVISSLTSSNDAPGIVLGKASDGVNQYVAVSSNGGRSWRLSFKGLDYLTAISNPSALIVTLPKTNQSSLNHSFRYSTDYGRNWSHGKISNDTSCQLISLIADNNNIVYILALNNDNQFSLIQLDFNLLIVEKCGRHQLKQWSLQGACVNGSKFYYNRRIPGSHCLDDESLIQKEPCACALFDFECLPGYRRSKDGICLPRPHYVLTQDCSCHDNSTSFKKRRGYAKLQNSQCRNGIEDYLSDTLVARRNPNHPTLFIYGNDSQSGQTVVEIHSNDFEYDSNDDEYDDDDDDEDSQRNNTWLIDTKYTITALAFDDNSKQIYMGIVHDQTSSIYRIRKNLQQDRNIKKLTFDSNNELYKTTDESIEYLTIDALAQNLYILIRNKRTLQQSIRILNVRTYKKRTILKNQHIQPSILIVDPIKANLYWISHESPFKLNIGNLEGQIQKQIQLLPSGSNISYIGHDLITHEIIFVNHSTIYGLNTLNYQLENHLSPRIIYEHSSEIHNALFIHPILYFTQETQDTHASSIYINSIDVVAKSFAKNIAKFKNLNKLLLLVDMAPVVPLTSTTMHNRCTTNPCSDICIPLENQRFRCLCSDDARYQSCSCPSDEKYVAGSCRAKNEQCAPGRVLCQNRINCAESANICEQDHTQYTESFKITARCTIDQPNDGFDCYYTNAELDNFNRTCIPIQWLCDGAYDCPYGNDEDHCQKIIPTTKPLARVPNRCLTDQKFTHAMCDQKCMKIKDLCQDISYSSLCSHEFHLHCKQTHDRNKYTCKCYNDGHHCIAMIENCDDFEHCEKICNESIHYANSKSNKFHDSSSNIWMLLVIIFLMVLVIIIILMILHHLVKRNTQKKSLSQTRTPIEPIPTLNNAVTNDAQEKLLNNVPKTANVTS